MKKLTTLFLGLSVAVGFTNANIDPQADQDAFINYFKKANPNVALEDYSIGAYALDEINRGQFEDILSGIAPYEEAVERGGEEFADLGLGKCAALADPAAARVKHPYFDEAQGKVITLEMTIAKCYNEVTGKKLAKNKGRIARLSAWISDQAAGEKINVKVESDAAKAAYQKGKAVFYAKRGEFNLSCADCHVYNHGKKARADVLSPALGHTTHLPMYRAKWGGLGTLHRRYGGCMKNMRAKPYASHGEEFANLEFYQARMNNGFEITADRYRK